MILQPAQLAQLSTSHPCPILVIPHTMGFEDDPFDEILNLEQDFYRDGYELGVQDGKKAGMVEGRFFGLEKGFEKFMTMGDMHGRADVWARRLKTNDMREGADDLKSDKVPIKDPAPLGNLDKSPATGHPLSMENPRLVGHVRHLYALTELDTFSSKNGEDEVADFDDRLKRAEGKIKVIERIIGERNVLETKDMKEASNTTPSTKGDGSIEDLSSLHVRH